MKHRVLGRALVVEDLEGVVPGLACVDHQGQVPSVSETDLCTEDLGLDVARRVVIVVIEAGLADCDDLRVIELCDDPVDAFGRVVGMDASRCPDRIVGFGDCDAHPCRFGVAPDGDHPLDTSLDGLRHRRCAVFSGADVAVVVGPAQRGRHDQPFLRGNSGSPVWTSSPPG